MHCFPSKRAYILLSLVVLADIVLLSWTRVGLSAAQLPPASTSLLFVTLALVAATLVRRMDSGERSPLASATLDRLILLFAGLVFLELSWISLRLFNHLTMATNIPYADDLLRQGDLLLGLDWRSYFDAALDNPLLHGLFYQSYTSLTPLSVLAFLVIVAMGDATRARFFLETFLVTAVLCMGIGMFFPAKAAVFHFIGGAEMFPGMSEPPGLYHLPHMEQLRSGLPVTLDLRNLPGLVTFPSFHTAAGVILFWSFRQTRLILPVSIYAIVMIASTPVFGGHYFVDLIAGALVAVAVLVLFQRSAEYRDLFITRRTPEPAMDGETA